AVLVCREPASVAPPQNLPPGRTMRWDGRFVVRLVDTARSGLSIGPLGHDAEGLANLDPRATRIPAAARLTFPAIRDLVGIVSVPHLLYVKAGGEAILDDLALLAFRPERPLTG